MGAIVRSATVMLEPRVLFVHIPKTAGMSLTSPWRAGQGGGRCAFAAVDKKM